MSTEFPITGGDFTPGLTRSLGWGSASGYDAVQSKGRRKRPRPRTLSEDMELRAAERRLLTSNTRDLYRNFTIAGWMVRCHLDYVSSFHFRMKTKDPGFNAAVEALWTWWSRAENCDPAGRFSYGELCRLWEAARTIDGDVLVNRLKNGQVQTIEGDRIKSENVPYETLGITDPTLSVVQGVRINDAGAAIQYMVHKRLPNRVDLQFDKAVPARFSDLFGYRWRYDQVRGISPLAAALNPLRDTYEGFEAALVKAKVAELYGLAITRGGSDPLDIPGGSLPGDEGTAGGREPREYADELDLGRPGPFLLDMDPGDGAEFLANQTPSTEFQSFTANVILCGLKALDIPLSFYDESHTNFSGSRLAAIQYEKSVIHKRERLRALRNKHTAWLLGQWVATDLIKPPAGMTSADWKWEHSHTGTPWYDPVKEVTAAIAAMNAGLSSEIVECQKLGRDPFELIDQRAEVQAYAKLKGVVLSTALASVANDDPNKPATQTEDADEVADQPPARKAVAAGGISPLLAGDLTALARADAIGYANDDAREHR